MVVQYLIEVGANVMARDDELDTPLRLALKGLRGRSKVGSLLNGFLRTGQCLLISGADMYAVNRKQHTPLTIAKRMKGTDIGCLFKEGSAVAVYEAGVRGRQTGYKSISPQRLWDAYLDKQTEAAIEALQTKKLKAEAAASEKSSHQNLKRQQNKKSNVAKLQTRNKSKRKQNPRENMKKGKPRR
jgi:ankyrin repeat protein